MRSSSSGHGAWDGSRHSLVDPSLDRWPAQHPAPVNEIRSAVAVGRMVGAKKNDHRRDILRSAGAPYRNLGFGVSPIPGVFDRTLIHWRENHPRCDVVDRNPMRTE